MFFHIEMSTDLILEPQYLGPQFSHRVIAQLYREVGSQCTGRHGYVVTVTRVIEIGKGKVAESGLGSVTFPVKYEAIVFRPFRHEVLDGKVTEVTKLGFFCGLWSVEGVCCPQEHAADL